MTEVTDKVIKGSSDLFQGTVNAGEGLLKGTAQAGEGLLKGTADMGIGLVKDTGRLAKHTVKRTGKIAKRLFKGDIKGTLGSSGKLVTGTFQEIVDDIEGTIDTGLANQYVSTTLKVLLAFYAAFAAPHLPRSIARLLDNTIVRILIAVVIIYLATKDPSLAILVALAFVLSLQTANKYKLIDTSRSISVPGKLTWLPSQQTGHPASTPYHHSTSPEDHLPTQAELSGPSRNIGNNTVQANGISSYNTMEHFTDEPGNLPEESRYASPQSVEAENMFTQHTLSGDAEQSIKHAPTTHTGDVSMEDLPNQNQTSYTEIQNNRVPGANQSSCVQSWSNENCPQGLNVPGGFDNRCGEHSPF